MDGDAGNILGVITRAFQLGGEFEYVIGRVRQTEPSCQSRRVE